MFWPCGGIKTAPIRIQKIIIVEGDKPRIGL
uniref:Uncharacterized protein n=1 Tax=Rhizobium phage IG49 TaxID=3129228 RepID=A0AAU8HZE1_9CAUD